MPANSKYLNPSFWPRFSKITAAILGGFIVSVLFHLAVASWFDHVTVIITSTYSALILWAVLMIVAFLAKNGWKIWGIYLLTSIILAIIMFYGKALNPIL
ncbi:MAG: hypothetical protein ABJO28_07105 [Maribacter dokdonensis]|uniref:Uncharacterized protein n=1 Tax=Maribacter dokdonensis TaxID=320912 RepID=A0A1H4NRP1_9FLAO|nr:hypothetical protein [Maribacter dokdonensis]MBU2899914.1 hypothetical protein [Maribacter dokdonensis]CAG2531790.1 hypothetical protein MAR621_02319 [Maribacter dokdonensis]SEB97906.1 hypothetical protein SAMN05192540_2041 [Maribacter dokdonensis]